MPRGKRPSVVSSREALPDSDDEADTQSWVKLTSRNVHTDVHANSRTRKRTRFTEHDEDLLSTPLDCFAIDIAQNEYFSAWLDSGPQDDTLFDSNEDDDTLVQPPARDINFDSHHVTASRSNRNLDDGNLSEESDDLNNDLPMEHDLSEFAEDRRIQVRLSEPFSLLVPSTYIIRNRPKLSWNGFL